MRNKKRLARQLIYDSFSGGGGKWQTLGELQQDLTRHVGANVDAARIVRRIPATQLKPLSTSNGYPAADEELILTAEGIDKCAKSGEDIANLLAAVRGLGRQLTHSDLPRDQRGRGARIAMSQLAAAASLPMHPNPSAVGRLAKILESEGWVEEADDTPPNEEREFRVSWEVQALRSVDQFSDYRKTKRHIRRTWNRSADIRRNQKRVWDFLLSNRWLMPWLTLIIAIGTVLLVINSLH